MKSIIASLSLTILAATASFGGDRIQEIRTLDGKVYQDCEVVSKDAHGLMFRHSRGAAKVAFAKLPKAIQEKYGYDAAEAQQFLNKGRNHKLHFGQPGEEGDGGAPGVGSPKPGAGAGSPPRDIRREVGSPEQGERTRPEKPIMAGRGYGIDTMESDENGRRGDRDRGNDGGRGDYAGGGERGERGERGDRGGNNDYNGRGDRERSDDNGRGDYAGGGDRGERGDRGGNNDYNGRGDRERGNDGGRGDYAGGGDRGERGDRGGNNDYNGRGDRERGDDGGRGDYAGGGDRGERGDRGGNNDYNGRGDRDRGDNGGRGDYAGGGDRSHDGNSGGYTRGGDRGGRAERGARNSDARGSRYRAGGVPCAIEVMHPLRAGLYPQSVGFSSSNNYGYGNASAYVSPYQRLYQQHFTAHAGAQGYNTAGIANYARTAALHRSGSAPCAATYAAPYAAQIQRGFIAPPVVPVFR